MKTPHNTLKQALAEGKTTRGVWLTLAHASIAEMAGQVGFDWALIDGEHAPNTLPTIQAQLQALAATPTPAVVRLPTNDAALIKQILELGAQSLVFPMIHDAASAADVVAATRYPPQGRRGIGSSIARSGGWGAYEDYLTTASDEICVIVQAESQRAVDNIDAIAAVDGVDCVFIGPADLSADMGYLGQPNHPSVHEAISHMVARIRAAGKAPGLYGTVPDEFARWEAEGVQMLAIGADSALLAGALRGLSRA